MAIPGRGLLLVTIFILGMLAPPCPIARPNL